MICKINIKIIIRVLLKKLKFKNFNLNNASFKKNNLKINNKQRNNIIKSKKRQF